MALTATQKWLRTIAWLRREFPIEQKVKVRSCKLGHFYLGCVTFRDPHFLIQVSHQVPLYVKLEVLFHEYAHCLIWFGADRKEGHSDEWGLSYARIYRANLEWDFGRREKKT